MSDDPRSTRVLRPDEALEVLGHGLDSDNVNPLTGFPLLAVALDDGQELRALTQLTRDGACVVIGVEGSEQGGSGVLEPSIAHGFDVLLTSAPTPPSPWVGCPNLEASLAQLADAVRASPLASLSLVQLLRGNKDLTVADALVAESWVYSMLQAGPRFRQWLSEHPGRAPSSSQEHSPVVVERKGPRLGIELNRPHVHNALNMAMREALIDALRTAVADPSIHEVHVSGRGASFCSGGDLSEFGTAPDPVTAHAVRINRCVGAWLARCADRVTMHLHGSCMGAGIELSAFAGHVRAAPDTRISLPEVRMGLIPGAGGTVSISRRIGRHRTAHIALTGATLSTVTALDWGLVDEIAPT